MQHDQHHRELAPTAEGARDVPGNFVLDIAGPDDQELREREIGPEHGEGQHQVAEVVELAGRHFFAYFLAAPVVHQAAQDENDERHRGERADDHENHAVDGGEPSGLERHDPVNHRKRYGHAPQDQPWAADALQIFREARVAAGILLARPFIQEMRQTHQNGEINYGAHDEKVRVQVRQLEMVIGIGGHIFGRIHPGVNLLHPDHDRDEEQRHHSKSARAGLQQTANGIAPPAAGEVMHHQDRHASQRNHQPVHIGEEISMQDLAAKAHCDCPGFCSVNF